MAVNREQIINRLVKNLAEVITEDELRERLASGKPLTHYIGFEISGYVHLGTGLMSALVMKDLTDLGVKSTVWLADWHTLINEKLDGTIETAQRIGQGYFTEALKASFTAVGGNPAAQEFRLASDWYAQDWSRYWRTVLAVARHTTTSRMLRSIDIMGRELGSDVDHAKTIYPAMQAADVFYQKIDLAHAGMDQRKAHVIVRDVARQVAPDRPKPIALHQPLLIGLQPPPQWPIPTNNPQRQTILAMKMSKSRPDSAIWVHDEPGEIERKIRQAFCPERETTYNPILNWVGHILFWSRGDKPFRIERHPQHGGPVEFTDYLALADAYAAGDIYPLDLKNAVASELIELLAPVREHFAKPDIAAKKAELDKVLASR